MHQDVKVIPSIKLNPFLQFHDSAQAQVIGNPVENIQTEKNTNFIYRRYRERLNNI